MNEKNAVDSGTSQVDLCFNCFRHSKVCPFLTPVHGKAIGNAKGKLANLANLANLASSEVN